MRSNISPDSFRAVLPGPAAPETCPPSNRERSVESLRFSVFASVRLGFRRGHDTADARDTPRMRPSESLRMRPAGGFRPRRSNCRAPRAAPGARKTSHRCGTCKRPNAEESVLAMATKLDELNSANELCTMPAISIDFDAHTLYCVFEIRHIPIEVGNKSLQQSFFLIHNEAVSVQYPSRPFVSCPISRMCAQHHAWKHGQNSPSSS